MILMAYRHGLRATSLLTTLGSIEFAAATLAVRRVKRESPSTHPFRGDDRALHKLATEQDLSHHSCLPAGTTRAPFKRTWVIGISSTRLGTLS
jgi:hypothetical protein